MIPPRVLTDQESNLTSRNTAIPTTLLPQINGSFERNKAMRLYAAIRLPRAALFFAIFPLFAFSLEVAAEQVEEVVYAQSLTETQVVAVSDSGTEILAEVAKARTAISAGSGVEARKHVNRARALLGEVRAMSPAVRFEHEIGKVLGKIANKKAGADDLLPIYAELDTVTDTEKAAELRVHVDRAKGHLEVIEKPSGARRPVNAPPLDSNQWRAAHDELVEACSKVTYMEIDLPVHETYTLLRQAQIGLLHNDLPAADASLAEVQKKVEIFVAVASRSE